MKNLKLEIQYGFCSFNELSLEQQHLVKSAREAIRFSHSPYSNFTVGCAIKTTDDRVFSGANQENASYGAAVCAERTTIFSAWNKGYKGHISTIAITGKPRNSPILSSPITPCGICRQVLMEEEEGSGHPLIIIMDHLDNDNIMVIVGANNLLPFAFTQEALALPKK